MQVRGATVLDCDAGVLSAASDRDKGSGKVGVAEMSDAFGKSQRFVAMAGEPDLTVAVSSENTLVLLLGGTTTELPAHAAALLRDWLCAEYGPPSGKEKQG